MEPFLRDRFLRCAPGHRYEAFRARFRELDAQGYGDKLRAFQALIDEFGLPGSAGEMVVDFGRNAWTCCRTYPGALEVLARLRSHGYRLAVVTNGSAESQRAKLRSSGLEVLVDAVLISAEEGVKKPARELFVRAAERLGVVAAGCVFVGDNPLSDVAGAQRAGMKAVWVRGRLEWPEDLEVTPDHTVDALPELLDVLPVLSSWDA
jgi:putative hydrolase of the HAD superfamily